MQEQQNHQFSSKLLMRKKYFSIEIGFSIYFLQLILNMISFLPKTSDIMKDEKTYRDGQLTAQSLHNLTQINMKENLALPFILNTNDLPQDPSSQSSLSIINTDLFFWDSSTQLDSLKGDSNDDLSKGSTVALEQPSPKVQSEPAREASNDQVQSFSEENESSQYSSPIKSKFEAQGDKQKRGRGKTSKQVSKDYAKNIVCNVYKRLAELIFGKWKKVAQRVCQQKGVTYQELKEKFYDRMLLVSGPNKLYEMLSSGKTCTPILRETIQSLIQLVLRRGYSPQIIRDGRMTHKEEYIRFKNEYLLYFPSI